MNNDATHLDALITVKWELVRLYATLTRGTYRQSILLAEDAITDVIKDLQDQPLAVRLAHSREST
ncbi:MAG: hypothetical protein KDI77_16910 [Gammaproteobacteria bacterium]|nr:hypothetical protein [Gammaproteobacteria bacterium]MCP5435178.1 hypothetical protein [Chromatiaceae bacterium]